MSPIADAGADIVIILPDNSVTLHGSGTDEDGRIVRYEWTQSSGPRNATIKSESGGNVSITDLIQGTYIFRLSVTDDHGLQGYDDITVTAVKAADEKYTIPRYFTPNSDGINDVWTWQMTDALRNASVTIFNRFGQKVFESAVYENNWDGKLNGKPLEQDAYYYVIRTDSQTLNGAVRIIK
jgi:gliding motility-associated-like protein